MAARLWTALLMLAAVFAMHGLQCTSAAGGAGSAATTAHVSAAAHLGPAAMTALTTGHAPVVSDAGDLDDPLPGHAGSAAAPVDAGHGGAPHDWDAHLWTACLAVLAAALAVLLALLVPRLVQLAAPALRRGPARAAGWLTPPRPPDLSALCLLRI